MNGQEAMFDEPWDDRELARREAELAAAGHWTEFELGFEPDWFGDEYENRELVELDTH